MDHDIGSPTNERIKRLVRLRKRRHRDEERLFPVEEHRVLSRAIDAGHRPREVYWCPDLVERPRFGAASLTTVSSEALARASYRANPEGVIALFPYLDLGLSGINLPSKPLILIAEGLEKPGNLGALMRIADAAGVDGVVIIGDETDPFNPNVVRSSTGALFFVPLARVGIAELTTWLGENGIRSVGAVADGGEIMWTADLTGSMALWIGAEADGLSQRAVEFVDQLVSIPMTGSVDSLNASVSGAVLVFEAIRQRLSSGAE